MFVGLWLLVCDSVEVMAVQQAPAGTIRPVADFVSIHSASTA